MIDFSPKQIFYSGFIFGISHLLHGIIVYFLLIGISTMPALTILCMIIFLLISILFFIIGFKRYCYLQNSQSPFINAAAVLSIFASISCMCVNIEWFEKDNPLNRIPFILLIVASLYLSFTTALVTLSTALNVFSNVRIFAILVNHETILAKVVCDLIIALSLSLTFGLKDVEDDKDSKTAFIVMCIFGAVPLLIYSILGCLLRKYIMIKGNRDIIVPYGD